MAVKLLQSKKPIKHTKILNNIVSMSQYNKYYNAVMHA